MVAGRSLADFALFEVAILDADLQPAGAVHGVARVDREVEDRIFKLERIDPHRPDVVGQLGFHYHALAQCAVDQLGHAGDQIARIDRLGQQGLGACEAQQAAGKSGGAVGALHRIVDMATDLVGLLLEPALGEIEAAHHHREHVVEIMRDAAGELAHRLHLLHLAELRFGRGALDHLAVQAIIGIAERAGAFGDGMFEPRGAVVGGLGLFTRATLGYDRVPGEPGEDACRRHQQHARHRQQLGEVVGLVGRRVGLIVAVLQHRALMLGDRAQRAVDVGDELGMASVVEQQQRGPALAVIGAGGGEP